MMNFLENKSAEEKKTLDEDSEMVTEFSKEYKVN